MDADTSRSAPDGGKWAWLAVLGCFMGNVIGDGVMYSFGVFVPKLKEHFMCGSGVISTVMAIQMGACFGSGKRKWIFSLMEYEIEVDFRTYCKLPYQQAWMVQNHNLWLSYWGCRIDAECHCSKHILPLLECWHPDRTWARHHLPAKAGLHHSVF